MPRNWNTGPTVHGQLNVMWTYSAVYITGNLNVLKKENEIITPHFTLVCYICRVIFRPAANLPSKDPDSVANAKLTKLPSQKSNCGLSIVNYKADTDLISNTMLCCKAQNNTMLRKSTQLSNQPNAQFSNQENAQKCLNWLTNVISVSCLIHKQKS